MYINTVRDFNFSTTYIYTLTIKCYATINLVWNTFIIIIIIIIKWALLQISEVLIIYACFYAPQDINPRPQTNVPSI